MRQVPPEQHPGWREAALTRDLSDDAVLQQQRLAVAEGRVRLQHDVVRGAVLEQLPLRAERVALDLVDRRPRRAEREECLQRSDGEVGHAERLALARVARRLHGAPHLAQRAFFDGSVGPVQQQQLALAHTELAQTQSQLVAHSLRAGRPAWHLADQVGALLEVAGHRTLVLVRWRGVDSCKARPEHLGERRPAKLHGAERDRRQRADAIAAQRKRRGRQWWLGRRGGENGILGRLEAGVKRARSRNVGLGVGVRDEIEALGVRWQLQLGGTLDGGPRASLALDAAHMLGPLAHALLEHGGRHVHHEDMRRHVAFARDGDEVRPLLRRQMHAIDDHALVGLERLSRGLLARFPLARLAVADGVLADVDP